MTQLDYGNEGLKAHGLCAEVDRLAHLLNNEPDDGSVIHWSMHFISSREGAVADRTYDYAAIRCGGRWYCTGERSPNGITWEALVLWVCLENVPAAPIAVADWTTL